MILKTTLTRKGKKVAKCIDRLSKKLRLTQKFLNYLNYYTAQEMRIILKYVKKHHSILDAGGGFGRLSIPLAKLGFSVTLLTFQKI